jgi:hypothetical protein
VLYSLPISSSLTRPFVIILGYYKLLQLLRQRSRGLLWWDLQWRAA